MDHITHTRLMLICGGRPVYDVIRLVVPPTGHNTATKCEHYFSQHELISSFPVNSHSLHLRSFDRTNDDVTCSGLKNKSHFLYHKQFQDSVYQQLAGSNFLCLQGTTIMALMTVAIMAEIVISSTLITSHNQLICNICNSIRKYSKWSHSHRHMYHMNNGYQLVTSSSHLQTGITK